MRANQTYSLAFSGPAGICWNGVVTASIIQLKTALEDVPLVLLSKEDQRVLDEARMSLEALADIDIVPTAVVFVGSSGSGKSAIVNAAAGAEVTREGIVRPTTETVVMAGSSGPVSLSAQSEYVHSPGVRSGVVLIDTPPWEHDPVSVRSAIDVSDLVVVVATPSRYADATLQQLLAAIPQHRPAAVVMNRVHVEGADLEDLLGSVHETYGADVIVISEGGAMGTSVERLLDGLDIDSVGYQRGAVLRSAASSAGRYVATAVAASSTSLGDVASAAASIEVEPKDWSDFTVFEDWASTRREMVRDAERAVRQLDDAVVESAGDDLAKRMRDDLGRWDPDGFAQGLDRWHEATVKVFVGAVKLPWWRRSIDDRAGGVGWRSSVNSEVAIPRRVERAFGARFSALSGQRHEMLVEAFGSALQDRKSQWVVVAARLGEYAPGVLFSIARGFGTPRDDDV
jgi:energy-coupling factor transporter ATP-binding protein EcfA2